MTKLSKKAVNDFQKLIKKKRDLDLSYDEAEEMALYWLEFVKLVSTPIPEDKCRKKD